MNCHLILRIWTLASCKPAVSSPYLASEIDGGAGWQPYPVRLDFGHAMYVFRFLNPLRPKSSACVLAVSSSAFRFPCPFSASQDSAHKRDSKSELGYFFSTRKIPLCESRIEAESKSGRSNNPSGLSSSHHLFQVLHSSCSNQKEAAHPDLPFRIAHRTGSLNKRYTTLSYALRRTLH